MDALAIIPSRYASTRLPGKPLLADTGWPMLRHVYERVRQARSVSSVLVATDDERIAAAVRAFGGEAAMTDPAHGSGTERIAEAAARLPASSVDVILNVQGDEPEIEPEHLDRLVAAHRGSGRPISTLACPFPKDARAGAGSPLDPACVKVVLKRPGEGDPGFADALYFSRSPIPAPLAAGPIARPQDWLMHVGVYAFSPESLAAFAAAPAGRLERRERLEQLRALEMGWSIAVAEVDCAAPGVDTPEDYAVFVARWKASRP